LQLAHHAERKLRLGQLEERAVPAFEQRIDAAMIGGEPRDRRARRFVLAGDAREN